MARTKTNEHELAGMTLAELRKVAKERGVQGGYRMRKEELRQAVSGAPAGSGAADGGGAHRGPASSKSLKYAQEIRSVNERPERPGRSLVTTNHDVIKRWAQQREAAPATVPGTEHDGRPGVLRFDFPGFGGRELEKVGWDEWFRSFDERHLNFLYQEQTSDGRQSNFFQLENPTREDG
jgi:hypothetical protein